MIAEIGPESAAETFSGPVESIASDRGTAVPPSSSACARALVGLGLRRRLHPRLQRDLRDQESRPFWKLRPLQIAITLAMVLLGALLAVGLVLTGPMVDAIAGPWASARPR